MKYVIASWNIEKNGQSSDITKQAKVSEFIHCCADYHVHIIFLCEVHSARVNDHVSFLQQTYGHSYEVESLPGGHSNAYVLMIRKGPLKADKYYDRLKGLNRGALLLQLDNDLVLCLAHFKSGQTGLTKDQLQQASSFLDSMRPGRWAIMGDMNWDFNNTGALQLPGGSHPETCWGDQTQNRGGILDWCLAAGATQVEPQNVANLFRAEINDMSGPDHRPVLFVIGPS
jgi:hypothetical protein